MADAPPQRRKSSLHERRRRQTYSTRMSMLAKQNLPEGPYKRFATLMMQLELHPYFTTLVTSVIVLAGILAGIQTYKSTTHGTSGKIMNVLDYLVAVIFTLEVFVKITARGKRPYDYFLDGWNLFDFSIVMLTWLPVDFDFTVLRTARLLRVLKLLNALPDLQILVLSLLKSVNSMFYVIMLLFLLFYLYAVMGCYMFQDNDPFHFRDLQTSFLSLYRTATFEDWTDIMYINMWGCDKYGYPISSGINVTSSFFFCDPSKVKANPVFSALFFCSFTLFATMIVFNLFIGVILTNMEKAKQEMLQEFEELSGEFDEHKVDLKTRTHQVVAEFTEASKFVSSSNDIGSPVL